MEKEKKKKKAPSVASVVHHPGPSKRPNMHFDPGVIWTHSQNYHSATRGSAPRMTDSPPTAAGAIVSTKRGEMMPLVKRRRLGPRQFSCRVPRR